MARLIEVTDKAISPERVIDKAKSNASGCVVTYVGLIREHSQGRPVLYVEYQDSKGQAENELREIVREVSRKCQVENVAVSHRVGRLKVGEINLVVAVASAHRSEGFAACQYVVDRFKERLPTGKMETYQDASAAVQADEETAK